jgi:hypothetical protein
MPFGYERDRKEEHLLREILKVEEQRLAIDKEQLCVLEKILSHLPPLTPTPTSVSFQEISMLPPVAGNTLVYTGTLLPAGSAYPTGTTFSLVSSDPTVSPTVDPTGLIVTIPLPTTFVDNPASPFNVVYTASGITPSPSTSPTSITSTITPSVPTPTPTGITFVQTT